MNRITQESIKSRIDGVRYIRPSGTTMTICIIRMVTGFSVTGQSACVDPANFNVSKGEEIAYENAFDKLWELEGYLLAERIYQSTIKEESSEQQTSEKAA